MSNERQPRPVRLCLESLEGREVPAGVITASLTNDKLTITGDDQANVATIIVEAAQVTVTPDPSTDVGFGTGVSHVFAGAATSVTADLKGGNDALSIDGTSDFILTGAANFNLGNGSNTLNLITTGKVELGSLAVLSGNGNNVVTVTAGAGLGKVSGAATFNYGSGNSQTILKESKFLGPKGIKYVAKGGTADLKLTNVTVTKALNVNTGLGIGSATSIVGTTLGGFSAKGTIGGLKMTTSTIDGNVAVTGSYVATLTVADSTITGDANLKGGFQAAFSQTPGTFSVRNLSLAADAICSVYDTGTSTTINGNLAISAGMGTITSLQTTALSEVKGTIKLKGGRFLNQFVTNSHFKADKDVNFSMGDGQSIISIGDGTAAVPVLGKLTIKNGNGGSVITLNNVEVTKATSITSGAGADTLTIDNGSKFDDAFSAKLGDGDSFISIAQSTGATAAVTFTGKATFKTGSGNDTLLLGLATGDTNSAAEFSSGGKFDGGSGLNTFDGLTAAAPPAQYTGLSAGDFLHWTDPNP